MATGTAPVWSTANSRRVITPATFASSLPALLKTSAATASELAATAGNSMEKSGAGIAFPARARSAIERTPHALNRAAHRDESAGGSLSEIPLRESEGRESEGRESEGRESEGRTSAGRGSALTAARRIQFAEPRSPMPNPHPPAPLLG